MNPSDYWHGLHFCWWLLCRDGSAAAISGELAGKWHDDGAKALLLGTYAEAKAAAVKLYGGTPPAESPTTVPATNPESYCATTEAA